MADRREFNRRSKVAMIRRATRDGAVWCEIKGCGPLKRWEYHHAKQDAMEVDKSRLLTEADGLLACLPCHDEITRQQAPVLAKVLRQEAAHLGATRPKGQIKSRGFARKARAHEGRPPVARRETE